MTTRTRIVTIGVAAATAVATVLTGPAAAQPSDAPAGPTTAATTAPTSATSPTLTSAPGSTAGTTTTNKPTSTAPATTASDAPTGTTENWSETPPQGVPESGATSAVPKPVKKASATVPTVAAASVALTIGVTGPLVGPTTITPGSTWTGTGSVTVIGTQGLATGWTATASLSPIRGNRGGTLTPTSATYNATGAGCSGTTVSTTVPLTSGDATIRTAGALCVIAGWNMTVAIAVPPSGVIADTYSATLTQSIA